MEERRRAVGEREREEGKVRGRRRRRGEEGKEGGGQDSSPFLCPGAQSRSCWSFGAAWGDKADFLGLNTNANPAQTSSSFVC